jgi:acetyl esterase/lipase
VSDGVVETVRFVSAGATCVADLLPEGGDEAEAGARPGLVIGRGFGGVRAANLPEARHFARAGYVVLSIDYRTLGESEGEPRAQAFPLAHVEDFRNAISYLQARPEVDAARIGLWGTSFAGGVVLYTAAVDRRVRAVVGQMPIVHGRRWLRSLRTPEQWERLLAALDDDRQRRYEGGASAMIPLSGHYDELCAMPTGDRNMAEHFVTLKRTFPTWREDVTLESLERVLEFDVINAVDQISPRAACLITGAGTDLAHPLDQIQEAYARCLEPRRLVLLPYDGLDLRFDPGWTAALDEAIGWLDLYLKR